MLSREAIQDQAHLLALRPDLELRLQDLEVVLDRLLACWIEIEGVEGLLVDLRAQLVHLRAVQGVYHPEPVPFVGGSCFGAGAGEWRR